MSFWFAFLLDPLPLPSPRQGSETHAIPLSAWAQRFSTQVVPLSGPDHAGFLIETGGSERLFGGRATLHRKILDGLHEQGFAADRIAAAGAPTPAAAHTLARARALGLTAAPAPLAVEMHELRAALDPLPLRALAWEAPLLEPLGALGVETVGDVLRLPRAAFARRFGTRCLTALDRMTGTAPDPQACLPAPECFRLHEELPTAAIGIESLQGPLMRLLGGAETFLRARNLGATALLLRTHHPRRRGTTPPPSATPLMLAAPERDATRLQSLFTERLTRAHLPEAVVGLELEVLRAHAFSTSSGELLPPAVRNLPEEGGVARRNTRHLCEMLHARLGSAGVFQLQTCDDHRPERAYCSAPIFSSPGPMAPPPAALRPLWILSQPLRVSETHHPQPRYGGPLALLAGPERIEAGWWDALRPRTHAVHRDYFVARNARGQTLWIYRELAAPRTWFLHGFFS